MTSLDKLTIDTPEQLALDFPLAGIGSRFLALALDTLIQMGAFLALLLARLFLWWIGVNQVWPEGQYWAVALLILISFVINFGYFAIFESIWNGQTPGKRRMQLRVIKDDGRPITVYDAVARNLMRLIDSLPGVYGVGILSMIFNKQNKRLGDYVAGTVVVHEKKLEGFWQAALATAAPAIASGSTSVTAPDAAVAASVTPTHDVGKLSTAEAQLVEAFLDRRSDLDVNVRRNAADQIASRIGQTLGVAKESRPSSETFLEEVLRQRRNLSGFST